MKYFADQVTVLNMCVIGYQMMLQWTGVIRSHIHGWSMRNLTTKIVLSSRYVLFFNEVRHINIIRCIAHCGIKLMPVFNRLQNNLWSPDEQYPSCSRIQIVFQVIYTDCRAGWKTISSKQPIDWPAYSPRWLLVVLSLSPTVSVAFLAERLVVVTVLLMPGSFSCWCNISGDCGIRRAKF